MTMTPCRHCLGKGVVFDPQDNGIPSTRRCICVLQQDVIDNLERRWAGLSTAAKITNTPLKGLQTKNAWITSNVEIFRSHFRHISIRQGPDWDFKIVSDANLMSSWLATSVLQGMKSLDSDVTTVTDATEITLHDLVFPTPFLVILLGIKRARNVAMPEVMLEAIQIRNMAKKPTWIVDQPEAPLNDNHLCYSPTLMHLMSNWERLSLETPVSAPLGLVPARFIHPTHPVSYRGSEETSRGLEDLLINTDRNTRKNKKR